jgi:DNA-binding IclR family transcriptional regulator
VLAKARNILDAFSSRSPELTISELVSRTGLPTSTCVRIVRNLAFDGLLERTGDRYRIGLAIVRWASLALAGRSLVETSASTLEWLRDETGESAQLCVREDRFAVVVAAVNSHHSVVRQLKVGEVNYLHAGSTGKVFLAFDPEARQLIRTGRLEAFTANTVTDRAQLLKEVDAIHERGYSLSFEERNSGAAGVTAPIFDATGSLAGSIGVTGPINRMTPETIEGHIKAVLEASRRITQQLGHTLFKEE